MTEKQSALSHLKVLDLSRVLVGPWCTQMLAAYGLDFDSLKALTPRLIYCSITGFGQTGPYAERAGYDLMIQAMSGMMSITGKPADVPGGGPQRVGVALLDVGMAILANQAAGFLNTGQVPQAQGNSHPSLAPYQDVDTQDGSMLLAVGNDGQFARFAQAAGHPESATDSRFVSNPLRVRNREALVELIHTATRTRTRTRTRTTAQWVALLEPIAVPCGPINDIGQAFADAQVVARKLVVNQPVARVDTAQAAIKTIASVASPLRLMDTPPVLRYAPPALGEHTDEVLAGLGLDAARIAQLRSAGIV